MSQLWKKAKRCAAFSHSCLDKTERTNVLGFIHNFTQARLRLTSGYFLNDLTTPTKVTFLNELTGNGNALDFSRLTPVYNGAHVHDIPLRNNVGNLGRTFRFWLKVTGEGIQFRLQLDYGRTWDALIPRNSSEQC